MSKPNHNPKPFDKGSQSEPFFATPPELQQSSYHQGDSQSDELEQVLAQLVEQIQKATGKTEGRKLKTQLISTIQKSKLLSHDDKSQFPEEVYRKAEQKLLLEVCLNIDLYNPANGMVTNWIESKFAEFLNVELDV